VLEYHTSEGHVKLCLHLIIVITEGMNLRNKTLCYFQWYSLLTNNFRDIIVLYCIGMKGESQPLRTYMTAKANKCIIGGNLLQHLHASYQLLVDWQSKASASRSAWTTIDKDVDHIALVSQLDLLIPQDSLSGAHTATASFLAATLSADSERGHLNPLGSPLPVLTTLPPARSHVAAEQGALLSLA
jgi:hypothetical protein